jgi:hypothetical protein
MNMDLGDDKRIPINQAEAIAPTTEFRVVSDLFSSIVEDPGAPSKSVIRFSKFLNEFGGFYFIFECDGGTYKRHFSVKDILDLQAKYEVLSAVKPKILRKQQ